MDSFEKLIPVIFLIIWSIIAVAAKKKKKEQQSRPDTPKKRKPRNPLLGNLQNTLDTFFTELQPQTVEQSEETDTFKDTIDEIDTEVTIPEIKKEPSKPFETKKAPSQLQMHSLLRQGSDSTARLREAVIWSEILGKPVSMREE